MNNLQKARLLNGWNLDEAAPRVGYKGKSGLWKLEERLRKEPQFIRSLKVEKVLAFSLGYGVSTDFVLGLSSDPEVCRQTAERMAVMRAVHHTVQNMAYEVAQQSNRALSEALIVKSKYEQLLDASSGMVDAVMRFIELNANEFLDLRNGANLQNKLDTLLKIVHAQKMTHQRDLIAAKIQADLDAQENLDGVQLALFAGV